MNDQVEKQLNEQYEKLVDEEELLLRKINTCEIGLAAWLETIFKRGDELHLETSGYVAETIHTVVSNFQKELLHVRIEKSVLSNQIS